MSNIEEVDTDKSKVVENGDDHEDLSSLDDDDARKTGIEQKKSSETLNDSDAVPPEVPEKVDISQMNEGSNVDEEDDVLNEASNAFRAVDAEGWEDLLGSGRLRRRVLVEGDPKNHPSKGSQVKIHYTGSFEEKVFEDIDLEFCVQEHEVIAALNLVLPLMNLGEKCEIITDPDFAYGQIGYPPIVPPNAAIHAVISLLEVHPAPVITEMSLDERKAIGHRKKERGNYWYSRQDYTNAVQCYRRAVEYFDDERLELEVPIDRFSLEEELQNLLEDRNKTYNNLAQAQMKLESWEAAMASLKNVLKIEPNNEKALYRKAKCLEERGHLEEAIGLLRRVTRLYPENNVAKTELSRLTDRRKKGRQVEERMSKRMLGLDKETSSKKVVDKKPSSFLSNKQWVTIGVIMGGAGVLLGGILSWFKVQF